MADLSEAARVHRAVEESVKLGTLTDELVTLVYEIVRRRVVRQLRDDFAQHVLLGLLTRLRNIDLLRDVYSYLCSAVVKTWKKWCRQRRVEQQYLLREAGKLLDEVPAAVRPAARRKAWGSASRTLGRKYY